MRDKQAQLHKKSTLKKAFHRTSFSSKENVGFFGEIVPQKSPSLPYEKQQPYRGFTRSKICTLIKPIMARLSDGSGVAQYTLKTSRSGIAPLCRKFCAPSVRGELRHTHFKVWQKSTGDIYTCTFALYHIYFCLSIKYKHLFVFLLKFLLAPIFYRSLPTKRSREQSR